MHLLSRLDSAINVGVPVAMDNAAKAMQYYIWYAFAHGGPGWKPLSPVTIQKKIKSGAPDPTAILKEFRVMMKSIQVKNETTTSIPRWGIATFWSNTVYKITNHVRSVGLFKDTALKYDREKEIDFRGPAEVVRRKNGSVVIRHGVPVWKQHLNVVDRGFKHEFGGFEYQIKKTPGQDVEEIRTGGLEKKALKGEGVVTEEKHQKAGIKTTRTGKTVREAISKVRKVLQKVKKGRDSTKSQIVYIPERSFLRDPFDRNEHKLINIIVDTIGKEIDKRW